MAKIESLTGLLSLEISEDGLEAGLVFEKGVEGERDWTVQDAMALLQQSKINSVKTDEVAKILASWAGVKTGRQRAVVAKGNPPQLGRPEALVILDLSVPDDLKPFIPEALKQAEPPEIWQEITVKIEREEKVVKKGPLPFLGGKEETVKVTDKEIKKERVPVNHHVDASWFVVAEQKIGSISPSKPGAPGKQVTGEMIASPQLPDPYFYVGKHIHRKGSELTAEVEGILRIGENWIDIVPFRRHEFSLSTSSDKATLLLSYKPGSRILPAPDPAKILEGALALGFKPEDIESAETIGKLLVESVDLEKDMQEHPISLAQDAFFEVLVGDDKLKAILNVTKGSGKGKALVMKDLGQALVASGLKFQKEKVQKDLGTWFQSPERSLIGYALAEGQAPKVLPPQSIKLDPDWIDGKELDELKKRVLGSKPGIIDDFPVDASTKFAYVDKDQRVGTLGPLTVGGPGMDVYGQVLPGKQAEPVKYKLFSNIELLGNSFIVPKRSGLFLCTESEQCFNFACIPHADGYVEVSVSADQLLASVRIEAHEGAGIPADLAAIQAAIDKAGVKSGIDQELLKKIAGASCAGEDVGPLVFARGKSPESGSPSSFTWLIRLADGQNVRKRADGSVDFKNLDKITSVKKDTAIAELSAPDHLPAPGMDVFGKTITPPPVASSEYEFGKGFRSVRAENGSQVFYAEYDGELIVDKGKLELMEAHSIKGNIDSATGNIRFPGAVVVSGDVLSGFFVMAGGDIKVGGSVEAALLSADGDILVAGGIKGARKALIRSKKSIGFTFAELSTLMAVGDIRVKKALLHARVKCNSKILFPDDGSIIGGEIKVKFGLHVGNLGNPNEIPTKIIFGQDILVEDQIEVEDKEIRNLQAEITRVNTAMLNAEKIANKEKLQELFNEKFRIMKMLEKRNLRLFMLKERFEQHFPSELIIKGTIHPGVVIESHGRAHTFTKTSKAVRITFNTSLGKIEETPLQAKS